ncbi:hypothetical protein M2419_005116 [Sphingobacterium sp. BIGb0116]|nr:hypothetical protein [Sphingobacterium sp. BIGb0116]
MLNNLFEQVTVMKLSIGEGLTPLWSDTAQTSLF